MARSQTLHLARLRENLAAAMADLTHRNLLASKLVCRPLGPTLARHRLLPSWSGRQETRLMGPCRRSVGIGQPLATWCLIALEDVGDAVTNWSMSCARSLEARAR